MAIEVETRSAGGPSPWRVIGWGAATLLLLLPLVAMQFTREVNWTVGDFLFAALMIGAVGAAFELTVRLTRSWAHRGAVAAALGAGFLTVWVNGAVGMIGSEENPYNLLFFGVLVIALLGSAVVRFRPAGMAGVMAVAAAAQLGLAIGGMGTDLRGGIFSAFFAALWLLAAALFRQAARDREATGKPD